MQQASRNKWCSVLHAMFLVAIKSPSSAMVHTVVGDFGDGRKSLGVVSVVAGCDGPDMWQGQSQWKLVDTIKQLHDKTHVHRDTVMKLYSPCQYGVREFSVHLLRVQLLDPVLRSALLHPAALSPPEYPGLLLL